MIAQSVPATRVDDEMPPPFPSVIEMMPDEFVPLWQPWTGDLDGMIERRIIRVLVTLGGYQYFFERGRPKGATVELLQEFERFLNRKLNRRTLRVEVIPIPVSRDQLIPDLVKGYADIIATDLTVTPSRSERVNFTRPLVTDVNEVIITGPSAPPIDSLDDLTGVEVFVRPSSSYEEHLRDLVLRLQVGGPIIRAADELLEAEDLFELVEAGILPVTVMDDYKAHFWSGVFPNVVVRDDLVINSDGRIAWAVRKDAPELEAMLNEFLRKNGRGTLFGNVVYNRYLKSAKRVRCGVTIGPGDSIREIVREFRKYCELYDIDWLMLTAQANQESGLNQKRRSGAGAVGIMQVKPSTAADRNVGVDNIDQLANNIHAGAKYMRFLADRYFSGDVDPLDQWFFSLAAYNAGPARVASLRREAAKEGHDPDQWFDQVEIMAARRIGRETVHYVSNIYKYYVGYRLAYSRGVAQVDLHGADLKSCYPDTEEGAAPNE